jgi:DNA-binding response OmpR family regulator
MTLATSEAKQTILVVEDDEWLRPLLAELLSDEGYRVCEAGSGLEGLYRMHQDLPDLVVLDVGLPWRSGLDVLEDLRAQERTRGVPVFLVSGSVDLVETRQAKGAAAAFHKPLDVEALLAKIHESLGAAHVEAPAGHPASR